MSAYDNREQTRAKHYILEKYLQALAFKVLHGWDLTYVDGFSGPWESKTSDFSDTSFMIAIKVLKDAQRRIREITGRRRKIRCFFSEKDPAAFAQLEAAVRPHHDPAGGFEVQTFCGDFVDAVPDITKFVGTSFPLIFIDPTGWTEYPFDKVASLFAPAKCEVIINFMYDHINRFIEHPDSKITSSLDPILGGPGWKERLDKSLKPGLAVEKLFRETLMSAGKFGYVVSTKIDKSTQDRPHFFLAYGTKSRDGLKAFRDAEYAALREHARNRTVAKERKREAKTHEGNLFAAMEAEAAPATIEDIVGDQKKAASEYLVELLAKQGRLTFAGVVDALLQAFMLRETNVKDACVELARQGRIRKTWGDGNRKPSDRDVIELIGRRS